MKLMGIDYGRRRIGIAVTDTTGTCIRGCDTIDRKKCTDSVEAVRRVVVAEEPGSLVIGLPLGARDQETLLSREIRDFAHQMRACTGLEIHLVDESFTSQLAKEMIRFRKKKERRRKENVDRIAACLILDAYQKERQCGPHP